MPNTSAPFGFRLFGRREGGSPTAGMDTLIIISSDTSTYFTGDLVTISSASVVAGAIGIQGATATTPSQGIFLGCEVFSPTVGRNIWSPFFSGSIGSSAPGKAYVCTDPDQLFIAQGTSAAVLGTSVIGWNINIASTMQSGGNTLSGVSNLCLQSTSVGGATTLPFRIVDVWSNYAPPGVNGTSSGTEGFQVMVVQPNNWARKSLAGVST